MSDYKELLEHSFATRQNIGLEAFNSRLAYLAEEIFGFTTYDDDMAELFGQKAIEVASAITEHTTFEYISTQEGHTWYLMMCNFPFFSERIEWGTSIRGAWWYCKDLFDLQTCGLWIGEEQLTEPLQFSPEEWEKFMRAIVEFGKGSPT